MKHSVFTVALIAALVLGAVTLGRDTPLRLAQKAPLADSAEVSIHAYGDSNQTCMEWTDGCRTCRRPENGNDLFCSNMPIACQPAAITCARRTDPPKIEPPKTESPK